MCFVQVRIFIFDHKNSDQKVAIGNPMLEWGGYVCEHKKVQILSKWQEDGQFWLQIELPHLFCWGSQSLVMQYGLLS